MVARCFAIFLRLVRLLQSWRESVLKVARIFRLDTVRHVRLLYYHTTAAFYDVCDFVNDLIAIYRSQEVVRQIGEHGFTDKGFGAIKHVTVIYF